MHDECRPRRKSLILMSNAADADFVEFLHQNPRLGHFPGLGPRKDNPAHNSG
jgi:hypothetical protein